MATKRCKISTMIAAVSPVILRVFSQLCKGGKRCYKQLRTFSNSTPPIDFPRFPGRHVWSAYQNKAIQFAYRPGTLRPTIYEWLFRVPGWFQTFTWEMVVSPNIHWKMVVRSSRIKHYLSSNLSKLASPGLATLWLCRFQGLLFRNAIVLHHVAMAQRLWYYWWKKSCTAWDV